MFGVHTSLSRQLVICLLGGRSFRHQRLASTTECLTASRDTRMTRDMWVIRQQVCSAATWSIVRSIFSRITSACNFSVFFCDQCLTRTAYLYNGCLPWYNVVLTSRVHSSVICFKTYHNLATEGCDPWSGVHMDCFWQVGGEDTTSGLGKQRFKMFPIHVIHNSISIKTHIDKMVVIQ